MAGEEVFTSNALISLGTAFFFFAVYMYYDGKGIKGILKPVFFIGALLAILNGWYGQSIAYKVTGLYDAQSFIESFWLTMLPYLIYGLLAAALIDLAFMAIAAVFYPGQNHGPT